MVKGFRTHLPQQSNKGERHSKTQYAHFLMLFFVKPVRNRNC